MQNTENTHIFRWYIPIISCFNPRSWLKVWICLRISARGQQHSVGLQLKLYHWERKMFFKKSLQHVMINLFYKYFLLAQKMTVGSIFFEMWFDLSSGGRLFILLTLQSTGMLCPCWYAVIFSPQLFFVIVFLMQLGFRAVVSSISFILLWFGNVLTWIQTLKSWQVCRGP